MEVPWLGKKFLPMFLKNFIMIPFSLIEKLQRLQSFLTGKLPLLLNRFSCPCLHLLQLCNKIVDNEYNYTQYSKYNCIINLYMELYNPPTDCIGGVADKLPYFAIFNYRTQLDNHFGWKFLKKLEKIIELLQFYCPYFLKYINKINTSTWFSC